MVWLYCVTFFRKLWPIVTVVPESQKKFSIVWLAAFVACLKFWVLDCFFGWLSLGSRVKKAVCLTSIILVALSRNSVLRSSHLLKHEVNFTEAECLGCGRTHRDLKLGEMWFYYSSAYICAYFRYEKKMPVKTGVIFSLTHLMLSFFLVLTCFSYNSIP